MSISSNITLTQPPAPQPPKQSTLNNSYYPANYVEHPNIGHMETTHKLFPLITLKDRTSFNLQEYFMVYQETYLEIVKDFDAYLEWKQEEFWKAWERNARFMLTFNKKIF
jgi:hypothetical protein